MGNSSSNKKAEDDLKKIGTGITTLVTGGYNKEIEDGFKKIVECKTTNRGSTMDEIRQDIKNINGETKQILNQVISKIGLYSKNAELSNIKDSNNKKEKEYITEQENFKNEVEQLYNVNVTLVNQLNGLNANIESLNSDILNNEHNIESQYKIIDERITNNDMQILESNKARTDINRAGFSIAYFEYLLMSSYNLIYRAIHYENNSIDSGKDHRESSNTNQLSNDVYQNDRVDFYKNVNTFLFYFYYLMIIALVIVVLKFNNTNLLIKLTFFRVFAIFLILYPIFIIRFQDFVYWFVKLMISKI
jgi:hypothetical protein